MKTDNRITPKPAPKVFGIPQLREQLRLDSCAQAQLLSRSVGRLTSCDALPCLEYGEEVAREQALVQRLLYLQQCRDALERCIGGSSVSLRYRWPDRSTSVTRFRRHGVNQVKVWGLVDPTDAGGRSA